MISGWVNSFGGPLICATPLAARRWRGVHGSSIGSAHTDYDRACQVFDYAGMVPCESSFVLVLGDEPMQSAFAYIRDEVVIVRWMSCVSVARANEVVAALPEELPAIGDPVQFVVNEARLTLFDAAIDVPHAMGSEPFGIDVAPGLYSVTVENYKQEQEFSFIVHRFRPQPVA